MIEEIIDWLEKEVSLTINLSSYQDEVDYAYDQGVSKEAKRICKAIKDIIQESKDKLASTTSDFYQPLTLTEAILHAENVAYDYDETHKDMCSDCKNQHAQLAEWLKELKEYKRKELEEKALNS